MSASTSSSAAAAPPGQWQPPPWATLPARPDVVLEVRRGEELLQRHELKGRKFFVLGRQPVVSHILVEDDLISRQHAALVHCKDAVYLFDLKSAKGVTVGGKRIRPMEPRQLVDGEPIVLGELALQYVVKGLAAPAASSRWQPPAWAVVPTKPVLMRLMRGEERMQDLDLSRKPAYVLGRNGQQADLVVPHDSVSRQHAAILHGAPSPDGSSTVHVLDLKSTAGTFVDVGGGWKRLTPNAPTLLPVGGRVRLGECSTLLVYPLPAPAVPEPTKAEEPEDDAPRFASMVQSTVITGPIVSNGVQPQSVDLFDLEAAPATAPATAAEGEEAADGGGDGADGEAAPQVSNSDIRNMLLPFIRKPVAPVVEEDEDEDAGRKQKKKKKKRRRGDDSSEDEREVASAIPLDKLMGPGDDPSGGLILRKQKAASTKSSSSSKKSTMKIKF